MSGAETGCCCDQVEKLEGRVGKLTMGYQKRASAMHLQQADLLGQIEVSTHSTYVFSLFSLSLCDFSLLSPPRR
eukprot:29357-Rhodomonas_salina.2